jgi:hypothetical protein
MIMKMGIFIGWRYGFHTRIAPAILYDTPLMHFFKELGINNGLQLEILTFPHLLKITYCKRSLFQPSTPSSLKVDKPTTTHLRFEHGSEGSIFMS